MTAADRAARTARTAEKRLEGTITRDSLLNPPDGRQVRAVRYRGAWYRMLKVNTTTVTVPSAWGATMRISLTKLTGASA